MALVGKLEDLPPAESMVYISDSMKTGKLHFTTGTETAVIFFREGKIVYAASSSIRETFGSIALSLGIINRFQLDKALAEQHRSGQDKRLGEIMIDMMVMKEHDIQRVLEVQVGQVVREIFDWKSGFFRFKNLEIEDFGNFEMDARDFMIGTPLDTRSIALDAARELDERTIEPEPEPEAEAAAAAQPDKPLTLAQMMAEVAGPALTAETLREILKAGASTFSRGVLMMVTEHSAQGLGHYGLEETVAPAAERVRELNLKMDEYSIISTAVQERQTTRGMPDHVRANTTLVYTLGGEWPTEAVVIPIMVRDRVALVLYGDNMTREDPAVGDTTQIEATLAAIGARLGEAMG
jgi:hypothetical protein